MGFIGYAKELYEIVHYSSLNDDGDDQGYYTMIYLDRALRVCSIFSFIIFHFIEGAIVLIY